MALLKSVNNVPGIDFYEYRDQNYWNKFKYRARLIIPGASYTYWAKNIEEWKEKVDHGRSCGKLYADEKIKLLSNAPVIEKFLQLKNKLKTDKDKNVSVRIEGYTTSIFSNDLNFIQSLKFWGASMDITEAIVNPLKGVKYFVNEPKNNFRVYFKTMRIPKEAHQELNDLLKTNKALVPSKAFYKWLTGTHKYAWRTKLLSSGYFIDYNEESTLSYLALMHGNFLGRKYKLEKRPDTE